MAINPLDTLFQRVARVTCWRENIPAEPTKFNVTREPNAVEIADLRIQAKIRRSLKKNPDSCNITITNLAASTRHNLETKPLLVQIEAGYNGLPRLLFMGDLRFGMSKLEPPNVETLLELGDGDCHHAYSRVKKSFGPGTTIRTVLIDTAASMGLTLPSNILDNPDLDKQYAHGAVAHGPARDKFTQVLNTLGYVWVIQNGKLTVLQDNEVSSTSALEINEGQGMIGSPEYGSPTRSGKPPHINVSSLLYPEILAGSLVKVTSKFKNGFFRVEQVEHDLDTHGRPWTTKCELKAV